MNGAWIRTVWQRRGIRGKVLWFLLLPASCLYYFGVQVRNSLYALRCLRTNALDKPVISIGNLTVGGTGKTPSCLWLSGELEKRGFRVGILSRGYRRKESKPVVLQPGSDGAVCAKIDADVLSAGDESSMMAWLYGQTVAVGNNRRQAAQELLSKREVDVFILDDGYQHRKLKRDVDLLLLGNDSEGWVLPAGPFRESRKALRRADYYLITAAEETWKRWLRATGDRECFEASLEPLALIGWESNQWTKHPLSLLYRSKILAVTGIADPTGLYRMIHEWDGEIVETLEFPDHHAYEPRDWQQMSRMARQVDLIVTTEKDLLKLVRFPFAKGKLLALRVVMTVKNGERLLREVINRIRPRGEDVGAR